MDDAERIRGLIAVNDRQVVRIDQLVADLNLAHKRAAELQKELDEIRGQRTDA